MSKGKIIYMVVPCYNEEENVLPICNAIVDEINKLQKKE